MPLIRKTSKKHKTHSTYKFKYEPINSIKADIQRERERERERATSKSLTTTSIWQWFTYF